MTRSHTAINAFRHDAFKAIAGRSASGERARMTRMRFKKRATRIKLTDPNGFLKRRKSCHAFGMNREYIFLHTIFSLAILLMAVLMAVVIGAG